MTTVELVRHAKAHSRDRWWGRPDRERPLTDAGWEQARALAHDLGAAGQVTGLYSSPYARCIQTLEPLAEQLGLPIVESDALAEALTLPVHDGGDAWVTSAWLGGRAAGLLDDLVRTHADSRVVACSHGDVVPALLALIAGRDGVAIDDVRCRKGGWFTLTFDGARCVSAAYHPPPDAHDSTE